MRAFSRRTPIAVRGHTRIGHPHRAGGRCGGMTDEAIRLARRFCLVGLRLALGGVFLWFGALKLLGISPVNDLVAKGLPFLPPLLAVLTTGGVELLVGIGLLAGLAARITMGLFFALLAGTFSLLVTHPELGFVGSNPLRLTTMGEFIVKNVVLIAAGLSVVAAMRQSHEEDGSPSTRARSVDRMPTVAPRANLPPRD